MIETRIKGLHHAAYRCRNSEETRKFYEDFLGLPLVDALPIGTTITGRAANVLHTFFAMDDGSCVAFFEEPDESFDFKEQRDFEHVGCYEHVQLAAAGHFALLIDGP